MMNRRSALVGLLLMGSGACALIYQVTWLRELRLVFGSTTAASAAVLAIFMGGLGMGNALLGRRADARTNPLAFYALLEGLIAITVGLSPWLIDASRAVYIHFGGQMALGMFAATAVRLLLSAFILLAPTVLMGGTLPAAVAAVTTPEDENRRAVAILYGVNTVGAVGGAMASTFLMLPLLGTRFTLWSACLVNAAVSTCAWFLSRHRLVTASAAAPPAKPRARKESVQQPKPPVAAGQGLPHPIHVYATAGVVGFAFMLMELVWYRMLAPILGGTTYTFGLILSVALLGIGLGAALYPLCFRGRQPGLQSLSLTCGLEAVFLAVPFALGDRLAIAAAMLHESNRAGFPGEVLGWSAIAVIVVLPAAILSGVQFPVLIALLGRGQKDVGRQVGATYAFNTLGSILGSLAGGFGLIPLLSAVGAWRAVGITLAGLCAYLAVVAARAQRQWRTRLAPAGAGILAVSLFALGGPTAVWRHGDVGAGRARLPKPWTDNAKIMWENLRRHGIVWQADGVEAGVAIAVDSGFSFMVNGKCDGNAIDDACTQIGLGILPAALHPDPKTCFVVGLGTGETAGWLGKIPSVERVDAVEIEPALDEMVRRCAPVNGDVFNNPKVHVIYNDAREVLLSNRQTYDIIASEPSNPYRAGIANLFTREFYEAAGGRLNEGGLLIQWLQAYETDVTTVYTVLATLKSVFQHVEIWQSKHDDMLLLCSNQPFSYTAEGLRRRIAQEPYRTALAVAWRATRMEGFLARYVAGERLVEEASRNYARCLNTDDHNRIEYGFARTLGRPGGFSLAKLHQLAATMESHRPACRFAGVDWEGVEDERTAMSVVAHRVPDARDASPSQAPRIRAWTRYLAGDYAGMIRQWESQPRPARYPTETALLGLAYAVQGDATAKSLAEQLRSYNPRESEMIQGIFLYCSRGRKRETCQTLSQAFVGLRQDPWAVFDLTHVALEVAAGIALSDRACARELLPALQEPFAALYADEQRREAAYLVASQVAPQDTVPLLESYEPNVPWQLGFLKLRADVYGKTRHRLAAKAQADLALFLRNKDAER
ncbi:MAG: fused MFS/spermidine synthase [Thermoguttaceae bacterium]|jgi:predicted membrane-bound spermidine synthase